MSTEWYTPDKGAVKSLLSTIIKNHPDTNLNVGCCSVTSPDFAVLTYDNTKWSVDTTPTLADLGKHKHVIIHGLETLESPAKAAQELDQLKLTEYLGTCTKQKPQWVKTMATGKAFAGCQFYNLANAEEASSAGFTTAARTSVPVKRGLPGKNLSSVHKPSKPAKKSPLEWGMSIPPPKGHFPGNPEREGPFPISSFTDTTLQKDTFENIMELREKWRPRHLLQPEKAIYRVPVTRNGRPKQDRNRAGGSTYNTAKMLRYTEWYESYQTWQHKELARQWQALDANWPKVKDAAKSSNLQYIDYQNKRDLYHKALYRILFEDIVEPSKEFLSDKKFKICPQGKDGGPAMRQKRHMIYGYTIAQKAWELAWGE